MSAQSAIILFAHGARDPKWAPPFQRIQALVSESLPDIAVELAFLERMTPDLPTAVERVAQAGAKRVTVIPLFLGTGGHVKEDLTALIQEQKRKRPTLQFRHHLPHRAQWTGSRPGRCAVARLAAARRQGGFDAGGVMQRLEKLSTRAGRAGQHRMDDLHDACGPSAWTSYSVAGS